jgi:hypothetical protein
MVLGVGFKMLAFPLYTSYMCDIRKGRRRTCRWEPSKDRDGYNLSFRVCVCGDAVFGDASERQ